MACLTGLLLIALFTLDWAKNCKAVNYEFKQYGVQRYGHGCKKGCFGFANVSDGSVDFDGTKWDKNHRKQENCVECKTITLDFLEKIGEPKTNENLEQYCNDYGTCFYNSKKKTCGAGSCPYMAAVASCRTGWKNGKCPKVSDENCQTNSWKDRAAEMQYYTSVVNCGVNGSLSPSPTFVKVPCSKLADYCWYVSESGLYTYHKFSSDNAKECKYECDHPVRQSTITTYEYTKADRKMCNKVYGCIYGGNGEIGDGGYCSYVAVWAFIVILVVVILVVIAIIALIVFLIFKLCGNKASQVSPDNSKNTSQSAAANEDGTTSDKAIHDQPVEGPYVVIKMGDKQLSTKKVANAPVLVWGETVVFDTLGNEDEDATFELQGTDSIGTYTLRILDYVNNKQRVPLALKNSAGADVGVLEVDIEIKAQEEPAKVSGIFFVDKYGPGSVVPKE